DRRRRRRFGRGAGACGQARRGDARLDGRRRVARIPRGQDAAGPRGARGRLAMTRTPVLAGNWKMHGARREAVALAAMIAKEVGHVVGREVVIAPPFTALDAVASVLAGTDVHLGAQNVHWETKGAFTGEVSAVMLREAGCTHVILGHSERRQYF